MALEVLPVVAGGDERLVLVGAHALELLAPVDEPVLDVDDLLVAARDERGDLALAVLEPVEPALGGHRLGLRAPDAVDDPRVLLGDALHELGPLQHVREAVGLEDHRHDVGLVGLVALDQPVAQRRARLGQARAQLDEADALLAQLVLEPGELVALAREVGLDPDLARLQRGDVALERVDAARVALRSWS